jgi:hypothetical protein
MRQPPSLAALVASAAFAAAALGASLAGAAPAPDPGAVKRMIFAKEAARELWAAQFPPPAMFWTPAIADVVKLERRLPAFLRRSRQAQQAPQPAGDKREPLWKRVPGYQRQYFGLVKQGRWIVRANFFCDAHGKDWQREPVMVKDGGDCYFQLEYDPKTGRFSELAINGEA